MAYGLESEVHVRLDHMPYEIVDTIISYLADTDDLKSLRLVCRYLAYSAAEARLFYRLRISKLIVDRDAFLAVTSTPRLASHVRQLCWEELAEDGIDRCEDTGLESFPTTPDPPRDEVLLQQLSDQVQCLFWLPLLKNHDDTHSVTAVHSFLPQFLTAVGRLPNLHTLLSKPMHHRRELQPALCGCYPVTVETLRARMYPGDRVQPNVGFGAFLIPAMHYLAARSETGISNVHYAEESNPRYIGLLELDPKRDSKAISRLRRLNLNLIGRGRQIESVSLGHLWRCVEKATSLTHLKVACERGGRIFIPESLPIPPRLVELHLDHVNFAKLGLLAPRSLVGLWKNQQNKLRSLKLTSVDLSARALLQLINLGRLPSLEELVIIPRTWEMPWPSVCTFQNASLLQFVRGGTDAVNAVDDGADSAGSEFSDDSIYINGSDSEGVVDDDDVTDSSDYTGGSEDMVDFVSIDNHAEYSDCGDRRKEAGNWILDKLRRNPEALVQTHKDRWDFYGWRELEDMESKELHWRDMGMSYRSWNEKEPTLSFHREPCKREHLKHDPEYIAQWLNFVRLKEDNGCVSSPHTIECSFPEDSDDEMADWPSWRFTHHSGATAEGADPLEYWSDWEGSSAGDIAEVCSPYKSP